MVTGWQVIGGRWYRLNTSGVWIGECAIHMEPIGGKNWE